MNLLAILSLDQTKRLGDQPWYSTVIPLIAMQIRDKGIGPDMTSGEFLTILLDLPNDVRAQMLAVTVHDQEAADEAVNEIKEDSHKGLLVGISVVFLIVCSAALMIFIGYSEVEGKPVSKESMDTIWGIIKEVMSMLTTQ